MANRETERASAGTEAWAGWIEGRIQARLEGVAEVMGEETAVAIKNSLAGFRLELAEAVANWLVPVENRIAALEKQFRSGGRAHEKEPAKGVPVPGLLAANPSDVEAGGAHPESALSPSGAAVEPLGEGEP